MRLFKENEIVLLLGAGASVDAGIPHSQKMISMLEDLVEEDPGWIEFRSLYHYVRSSIFFSDGIHGRFDGKVNYNIERLVNTLEELSKKREHTLYPFVGAWNPMLVEVAGPEFELVSKFHHSIVNRLRSDWITLKDLADVEYFKAIAELQKQYQYPLRVFTLNYDLCVERALDNSGLVVELGFDVDRKWDWRRFDDNLNETRDVYLYKLHGSTNWTYEGDNLTHYVDASRIQKAGIIFGTSYKLQYRDPFLFLAYQFRQWTLEARIIVSIGYGFGDEHINKILQQALNANGDTFLLCVAPIAVKAQTIETRRQEICKTLELKNIDQILVVNATAREFMSVNLNLTFLAENVPVKDPAPFPVLSSNGS